MNRRYPLCLLVIAAAVGFGHPLPARAAGRVVIGGVSGGRHADPFLDAAEALVRIEGFQGDFATLVGLAGLADEATMCRQDCDCRETLHSAERLAALVASLKGSVTRCSQGTTATEAAWGTIEAELRAGRPLLAEGLAGPTSLGLIIGCDPQSRTLIALDRGKRFERAFGEWVHGSWAFSSARLGTTQLPGPKAELDAVSTMFARARQPRIEGGCVVRNDRTENAMGLEAYSLWSEQVRTEETPDANIKGQRLEAWVERRRMLAKFLRNAAEHQEPDTASHLRQAAGSVESELKKGLVPLAATAPFPAPAGAKERQRDPKLRERQATLMEKAGAYERQFLAKIEPVVFRRLRLPKDAQRIAGMKPAGPVKAATVRKLLKSRDSRVRTLGAIAAARSRDATMSPELLASLKSTDRVEARTSLSALKTIKPDNLVGKLQQQMEDMQVAGGTVAGVPAIGAGPADKDAIQHQIKYAIDDLKGHPSGSASNPIVDFVRGPGLFWILGLAVVGFGIWLWKLLGPKRLVAKLEEPTQAATGLPTDAARLEALLAHPPATGLLLTHVARGGIADQQKLKPGDVICRYGGAPITSLEDLRREIFKPGPRQREIAARRGLSTVKTVVPPGPLGLGGVAVKRGEMFWKRLEAAPFTAEFSGLEGEAETWYRLTRNGRACGFERRRRRWVREDLEVACITGLTGEEGEESARVTQRLRTGERLTCAATKFQGRGARSVEADASCTGGRWVVLLDGKALAVTIPAEALPSHALAVFAATLPFEAGRAYDVVRIDEFDFTPSYGCQIACLGSELIDIGRGDEKAWRFELMEYGVRQMTFWFDCQRQLLRTDYGGLVATLSTREAALDGLSDNLRALAEDAGRVRLAEPVATKGSTTNDGSLVGGGTGR